MRRREFIKLIVGSLATAWPLAARAQQQAMPVIGFISSRSQKESTTVVDAFRQGLGDLGYVEGQNVAVEYQWADGQLDRLSTLAAHLVNRRVAVIVAAGGGRPALGGEAATSTNPIVFFRRGFSMKMGLVSSVNRPGGNVTGASLFTSELETKKFALLRELLPKASLIAILVNPSNPSAESDVQDVQSAAASVGQRISLLKASSEREIDAAFEVV